MGEQNFYRQNTSFQPSFSPQDFSAMAYMIAWTLHNANSHHLTYYLDDFLFLVNPQAEEFSHTLLLAKNKFATLRVPVAHHKTEGSASIVAFLGICTDTVKEELRFPQDKIQHLQELIHQWSRKRATTRKELEFFIGHLSYATTVVRPGRTFLKSLFSLLHRVKSLHHYIHLSAGAQADIMRWRCLLE